MTINEELSKKELEVLLKNQKGEPFWSIMETENGIFTGNFYTRSDVETPLILLFLAKYDADLCAAALNLSEKKYGRWLPYGISPRLLEHLMLQNDKKRIVFGLTIDQLSEDGNLSSWIVDSKGIQDYLIEFSAKIKEIPDLNLSFAEWVLKYANLVDGPFIDNTTIKACDKCMISKVLIAQPNFVGIGINFTPMYCNLICKKNQQNVIYGKGIVFKEKKTEKGISLGSFLSRFTHGGIRSK